MQTLNKKMIIDFRNIKSKTKLNEKKDNILTDDEMIEITTVEEVIKTIHYLVDYVSKYILINEVMSFDEIYKAAKKD